MPPLPLVGLVGVVLVDAGVHARLAGGLLGIFRIHRVREHRRPRRRRGLQQLLPRALLPSWPLSARPPGRRPAQRQAPPRRIRTALGFAEVIPLLAGRACRRSWRPGISRCIPAWSGPAPARSPQTRQSPTPQSRTIILLEWSSLVSLAALLGSICGSHPSAAGACDNARADCPFKILWLLRHQVHSSAVQHLRRDGCGLLFNPRCPMMKISSLAAATALASFLLIGARIRANHGPAPRPKLPRPTPRRLPRRRSQAADAGLARMLEGSRRQGTARQGAQEIPFRMQEGRGRQGEVSHDDLPYPSPAGSSGGYPASAVGPARRIAAIA